MTSTAKLRQTLQQRIQALAATDLSKDLDDKACVAAILRGSSFEDLEIGYIRRAISEHDRWSGQMAFPGGKQELTDSDDLATAIRETEEETGIRLEQTDLLGRLHDVQARRRGGLLNFYIRPFVFFIEREVELRLDPSEVAEFFWVPVSRLKDPSRVRTYTFRDNSREIEAPAIELHGDPPLWGLTYMMTQDCLGRLLP